METPVEQLIKERAFASLSEVERLSVAELCESEEEFLTMKAFFVELDAVSASHQTIIHPDIKNSLDAIYTAKYPGITSNWSAPETQVAQAARIIPFYQKTWVRVAAVGLIVLGTVPFWNLLDSDITAANEKSLTAKLESPASQEEANANTETNRTTPTPTTATQLAEKHPSTEFKNMPSLVNDEVALEPAQVGAYGSSYEPEKAVMAWSSSRVGDIKDTKIVDLFDGSTGEKITSFSAAGREADLYPNDLANTGKVGSNAISLAEEPDDLLDFLVPAF